MVPKRCPTSACMNDTFERLRTWTSWEIRQLLSSKREKEEINSDPFYKLAGNAKGARPSEISTALLP